MKGWDFMDIKSRLLELPTVVKNVRLEMIASQESLAERNKALKKLELEQMNDIANAVDGNGKALFSNDVKRQAELQSRKESNQVFRELEKEIETLTYQNKVKEIELSSLIDEQSNLRSICRLESAE
jgi:hypothetical protein